MYLIKDSYSYIFSSNSKYFITLLSIILTVSDLHILFLDKLGHLLHISSSENINCTCTFSFFIDLTISVIFSTNSLLYPFPLYP